MNQLGLRAFLELVAGILVLAKGLFENPATRFTSGIYGRSYNATSGIFSSKRSSLRQGCRSKWAPTSFAYILSLAFSMSFCTFSLAGMSLPGDQEQQGIITDKDYSVETLVRDIFVKGSCDNVSNIQPIGDEAGIGYFENGADVIGLDKGIILSSGDVEGAEGPNSNTRRTGNFEDKSGDKDLKLLATSRVFDAVGIEFDFVPLDSFVAFRYVFASEEYCEFVGTDFNDVFGFFVSGPGIEGEFSNQSKNVALIPNTNDFVAINSVNHQKNKDYFINNLKSEDADKCGIPYVASPNIELIEYDGFTTVLEARLKLIPCETYHIRFVVADVNDNFFDSAVFLEAGSFNLGGEVQVRVPGSENDDFTPYIVEEGCQKGIFYFERADPNTINFPLTVRFKSSELSSAVEGMDYDTLPDYITIPEGEMSAILPVTIINDFQAETPEKLVLELDIPCACYTGVAEMTIHDPPPLEVLLGDRSICDGEPAGLAPQIISGTPPYSFSWDDGSTDSIRMVQPAEAAHYSVTVLDDCQNFHYQTIRVQPREPPTAVLARDAEICKGEKALLSVSFDGEPPYSITYSRDNILAGTISGIMENPYDLAVGQAGIYRLARFSDNNCEGYHSGSSVVKVKSFEVDWAVAPVSCFDGTDGSIEVEVQGEKPPYSFTWSKDLGNTAHPKGLASGKYRFTVTDAEGCAQSFEAFISSPSPIEEVTFNCDDLSHNVISINADGGVPPYRYSADGANFFTGNDLFKTFTPGNTYDLFVQDDNNCLLIQEFTMPAPFTKLVKLPPVIVLNMGDSFTLQPALGIPQELVSKVRWLPGQFLSCNDCLSPDLSPLEDQFYTLKVEDQFGCQGSATTTVKVKREINIFVPNVFSPNADAKNDRLTVFANARQVVDVVDFQVFDRWGNLMYHNENFPPNDPVHGWDGTLDGRRLPAGIYVYFAKAKLIDNTEEVVKGQVMLLK